MPLARNDVIGILSDNLRLRGSVLPIPARRATRWARELGLPRGGPTILYTGSMYQLVPYIERLVRLEVRFGDSPLARLSGIARRANRIVNAISLAARPSLAELKRYDKVPADVARLLLAAGVEFGYLYEDDLYTGALTYDLGADEVVAMHARRIAETFRTHGVQEVITIDPHTTTMLRTVFPTLLDDYTVSVRTYLEMLAASGLPARRPVGQKVVIHDSCLFARKENVVDQPRQLLEQAGLTVGEPEFSRNLTWCCGGPAEALFPAEAAAVASGRVAQLREVASDCVTMCPICLVNLTKAAEGKLRVRDISEYLAERVA